MASAISVVSALVVASCGGTVAPSDAVIIKVGGIQVHRSDYESLWRETVALLEITRQSLPEENSSEYFELRASVIEALVRRAVFEQEAVRLGVQVTQADVQLRIEEIKDEIFGGSEDQWLNDLRRQQRSIAEFRETIYHQLIELRLYEFITRDISISNREVESYYRRHGDTYRLGANREIEFFAFSSRREAEAFHARVSADNRAEAIGGGQRLRVERDRLSESVRELVFRLETGAWSKPILLDNKWHVIRALSSVQPARRLTLEEAFDAIQQQLLRERRTLAIAHWTQVAMDSYQDRVDYSHGFEPGGQPSRETGR